MEKKRYWNTRNLKDYIASASASRKEETLSRIDLVNERIMLGLRQSKGIKNRQPRIEPQRTKSILGSFTDRKSLSYSTRLNPYSTD